MIHYLNLIRYVLAVLAPILIVCEASVSFVLVSIVLLLLLNNIIDDAVFYYGGAFLKKVFAKGAVLSPIEGLVTNVEKNVPFKRYINKYDVIGGITHLSKCIDTADDGKLYTHITVFLNKFNKHIVCNIGSAIVSVSAYNNKGELAEMVKGSELIAEAVGSHCYNTFYEIRYANGCIAIVTMDKFVSKFKFLYDRISRIDGIIYRGSQCDLYVPQRYSVDIDEGMNVGCLDPIVYGEGTMVVNCSKMREVVFKHVSKEVGGFGEIVMSNVRKTLKTNVVDSSGKFFFALISFVISPILIGYVLAFLLFSFYYKRSIKNLLYTICNVFGYSRWMSKTNTAINELLI